MVCIFIRPIGTTFVLYEERGGLIERRYLTINNNQFEAKKHNYKEFKFVNFKGNKQVNYLFK